jgi:hypothetical protein
MKKPKALEPPPDFSFPKKGKAAARPRVEEAGPTPHGDALLPAPEPEAISPDKIKPEAIPRDKIKKVNGLHKRFFSVVKRSALIAFEIGKLLREIWGQLDGYDSWPQWCADHLAFDVSTANRYLRVYENYKDNPGALTGQTISGALKLLSAPRREPREAEEYGDAGRQPELPWERYFELPPLSREVKLNNYRFEVPNSHEVYLIRRGINYPVKIAEVLAPEDERLKTAHRGMLETVQSALERYYAEVERIETLEVPK